ncbi:MAG: MFS transporter, partial [Coraliomargarita sp.]
LGQPVIGYLQETSVTGGIQEELPEVYESVTLENSFLLGDYTALDAAAVEKQPEAVQAQIDEIRERETQGALAKMTIFPAIMLATYIGLFLYFRSQGGYKPKVLGEAH